MDFRTSFCDELTKLAKHKDRFEDLVHHPLTQAGGYGALTAEGLHALAHGGFLGKRLARLAGSRAGQMMGAASLAGSSAFLGAEGLAALKQALRRRKTKE